MQGGVSGAEIDSNADVGVFFIFGIVGYHGYFLTIRRAVFGIFQKVIRKAATTIANAIFIKFFFMGKSPFFIFGFSEKLFSAAKHTCIFDAKFNRVL